MVASLHWFYQFAHPGKVAKNGGYWFYSGIFALSYLGAILGIAYGAYKRVNCHADGCFRIGWHHDTEGHGHLLCKKHHPHGEGVQHQIGGVYRITKGNYKK
jgi:hypothetical protein